MNLTFLAESVSIEGSRRDWVEVTAKDANTAQILDQIGLAAVITRFGTDVVLDEIGQPEVQQYFNLVEPQ